MEGLTGSELYLLLLIHNVHIRSHLTGSICSLDYNCISYFSSVLLYIHQKVVTVQGYEPLDQHYSQGGPDTHRASVLETCNSLLIRL